MRFSHKYKILLISNWKCGCSTIADMFSEYTEFDWHTRHRCKTIFGKDYDHMVHYPAKLIKQEFLRKNWNFDEYITISSVRNPWARTVSLYFQLKKAYNDDFPSFEDFVFKQLPNWRSGLMNRWNTYEMFHDQGERIVNYIVRLENLKEDLQPVVKENWPQLKLDFSIKSNSSKHKHYSEYYTPHTKELVAEFFDFDIRSWDYQFEETDP